MLDSDGSRTYLPKLGPRAFVRLALGHHPDRSHPNESPMGSTPSGRAKPITGAALPPHTEIDRDGGSRASAGGRI